MTLMYDKCLLHIANLQSCLLLVKSLFLHIKRHINNVGILYVIALSRATLSFPHHYIGIKNGNAIAIEPLVLCVNCHKINLWGVVIVIIDGQDLNP